MGNVEKIKKFSIQNGVGIRTSIFFSGCDFHCRGCFNVEAWDFNNGELYTNEMYRDKIKPTINKHISGISILGGEPLHRKNILGVACLVHSFKRDYPQKTVWLWTGFTFEDIIAIIDSAGSFYSLELRNLLGYIDVLVDGKYIDEQRDLKLKWRGSKNQRVIDVKKSLNRMEVVLYE